MTDVHAVLTPDELRRKRRLRTLMILGSISIGWKVLVFTLGIAIPRWIIEDGIDDLPPERRAYAKEASVIARGLWTNPIERYGMVRAVRVLRVDSITGGVPCVGMAARVKAYTYFAIPYSEALIRCDGGRVLYRMFKRSGSSS